jgi:hypothetical protein
MDFSFSLLDWEKATNRLPSRPMSPKKQIAFRELQQQHQKRIVNTTRLRLHENLQELQAFLGVANYFRDHIQHHSVISRDGRKRLM